MKVYGLVLGGGGAKGSYEIGVWKALRELKIPIIAVAGTSVGALNGAMIVQDDYDKAFDLWTNISVETIINMNEKISELDSKGKAEEIAKLIKVTINSGGLDITPLKQLLNTTVNEEKIRKSSMEFGFVTFSMTDLKPVSIFKEEVPEGQMIDYLLASAAFPAFQPLEIEGKKFIDGGVYDNIPISLMLEKGIYDVISIDVSGMGLVRKVKNKDLNMIQIKNSEHLGPTLGFSIEGAKRNIEIGYYDTMKTFGKYKGKYYYFTDTNNSIKFDVNEIKLVYDYLGVGWDKRLSPQNRFIIYKLIKNLKNYCIDKKFKNSTGVILAAAEITAEIMKIQRIKEYSLKSLISAIMDKYKSQKADSSFDDFSKLISKVVWSDDGSSFTEKMAKIIRESRFAAFYNADINDISDKSVLYRRFLAITFPKVCIANIFIAFMLNKEVY